MKKILQSFTSLTRTERYGIIGLLLLCICFVLLKATMHFWVKPQPVILGKVDISNVADKPLTGKLDINTADSIMLIKIKGIGPALSHRILERRRELGKFENIEQVLDVYKFPKNTKETLVETLIIK